MNNKIRYDLFYATVNCLHLMHLIRKKGCTIAKETNRRFLKSNYFFLSIFYFWIIIFEADQEMLFNFAQIFPDFYDNGKMILLRGVINFPIWTEQSETWLPIESFLL